jgi:hypothetical protein
MLTSEDRRLFENSLQSKDPAAALSDAVRRLHKESGKDRQDILAELEEFRSVLREQNRDADEDVVLEVMDFLVGWSSPHKSLADVIPDRRDKSGEGGEGPQGERKGKVPFTSFCPKFHLYPPGGTGIMVDRRLAALLRDQYFSPDTAINEPTIGILDLTGVLPTPSVLQDLILPLMQRIRGGLYSQLKLFVITHDHGVADFLSYLAKEQDLALFVALSSPEPVTLYSKALHSAHPVGDLTSTEQTTLNVLIQLGGTVTASDFGRSVGIGSTAAGNRLTNLFEKGFLYRYPQTQREGYVYVDPRSFDYCVMPELVPK